MQMKDLYHIYNYFKGLGRHAHINIGLTANNITNIISRRYHIGRILFVFFKREYNAEPSQQILANMMSVHSVVLAALQQTIETHNRTNSNIIRYEPGNQTFKLDTREPQEMHQNSSRPRPNYRRGGGYPY